MFEKIFGKKKSIQRSLVRSFIISIALVIIITIINGALEVNVRVFYICTTIY